MKDKSAECHSMEMMLARSNGSQSPERSGNWDWKAVHGLAFGLSVQTGADSRLAS